MKQKLAALLEADCDAVCDAWAGRLSDPAQLAASVLQPGASVPVRPLLLEVVRRLRTSGTPAQPEFCTPLLPANEPAAGWRINLCQALEVLLTGEVVVRFWARARLDLSESEALNLFEQVNRVFHQLLRDYALRYCEHCRAAQEVSEESGR